MREWKVEKEREVEIGWTERLVSPQAEEKRKKERIVERGKILQNKQGEEDATAAAFVKICQIFNPVVLSVLLCNRWWGPRRPHFTHKYTQINTQSLSPVSFLVLFLYRLNEYFITSNINIHSNGFAHSYYRYFLKEKKNTHYEFCITRPWNNFSHSHAQKTAQRLSRSTAQTVFQQKVTRAITKNPPKNICCLL